MPFRPSNSDRRLLGEFVRRLDAAVPGAVIGFRVFGSRARGDANERSDLDLALEPAPQADLRRVRQAAFDAAEDAMEATHLEAIRLATVVLPMDGFGLAAVVAREGTPIDPRGWV